MFAECPSAMLRAMERVQILEALDELVDLDHDQRSELELLAASTTAAELDLEAALSRGDMSAIGAAARRGSLTDEEYAVVRFGLAGLRALVKGMESQGEAPPTDIVDALSEIEAWALPRIDQYEAERLGAVRDLIASFEA
jgi:hypothetical protein